MTYRVVASWEDNRNLTNRGPLNIEVREEGGRYHVIEISVDEQERSVQPDHDAEGIIRYLANIVHNVYDSQAPKKFTLYWRSGETETVEGASIDDAFSKRGYGTGALAALDFYDRGEPKYWWDPSKKDWVRVESA